MVMMGLFDCVDDTVLVKKALLSVSFDLPFLAHFFGWPPSSQSSFFFYLFSPALLFSFLPSPPSCPFLPSLSSSLLPPSSLTPPPSFTRRYVTLLRSCVTTCMAAGCCCICSVLATDDTSVRSLSVFSLLVTTTSTGTDHIRRSQSSEPRRHLLKCL